LALRIYISVDIEGVAGVVASLHGQPGNPEYERARRLMTEEANAAIDGAFAAGASEVLVNDAHGPMINLLPEQLDPRAELILGKPKPVNMLAGLEAGSAGVMLVGYHSGAGQHGVLSHTVNGFCFRAIRLNGRDCAEATLYGAYAGSLGVPVILLSGDDRLAVQCAPLFPGAQVIEVKRALGHRAARALSPAAARDRIRAGAEAAVRMATEIRPFSISPPYQLEIDLANPALADLAATIPAAERFSPVGVSFAAGTMAEVIGWVNTISYMSAFLR
jgi:D-amino peptidase